ncbi:septum formation family protein [Streptomonospora litoralis]|uniref:Septum formation-related domain-containing protein n=1 Tax=Streptomonospora litoralis TaxID=2498135 RepID=A0A4P6Q2I6_9ACTN|nr:septum formation family protein [Streptomonospora litoralis]QBI54723.1 hypothetical protein EKD16_14715 [Streptomonospora litoralis]
MPSTTSRPTALRLAGSAAAVATGMAISGCGVLAGLQGDVFQLKVGDCLADELTGGEITEAATVECDRPHYGEVFASIVMEDGDYPGDAAVSGRAEEECTSEFESFVGAPLADSELEVFMLHPSERTWNRIDDREILCIVHDPAGETTGSLSGAAR